MMILTSPVNKRSFVLSRGLRIKVVANLVKLAV